MMTASKALIALCILAIAGAVLVIGPDGLRRMLPGKGEVAGATRPDNRSEGTVVATTEPRAEAKSEAKTEAKPTPKLEPKTEPKAESKPTGNPQAASSAAAQPAAPNVAEQPRQATAALADLAPSSPASPAGPRFDVSRVDPDGVAVIAGQAAPGARVELMRGEEALDSAVADAAGQFVMIPQKLPPGRYELTLRAKASDGTMLRSSQSVAVALAEPAPAPPRMASAAKDAAAAKPKVEAKQESKGETEILSANAAAPTMPPAEAPTGAVEARGLSRIVSRGDSLWAISRRAYGDGARYARIFNANRDKIHNPDLIYPGQTFVLPKQ